MSTAKNRRRQRAEVKRQMELARQAKEDAKLSELVRSRLEVESFESQLEVLLSVHEGECPTFVWRAVLPEPPPLTPLCARLEELAGMGSVLHFTVHSAAVIEAYIIVNGRQAIPTEMNEPRAAVLRHGQPHLAVRVEKDGSERLFFVVETKSSLFTDDLRDRESGKIKCGEAHFAELMHDADNPARFIKASKLEDVLLEER